MLTFDLVSLGQDLLGKALGEISLNLVQFLIKGEVFDRWFRRNG
jgi:hypothetical protein